MEGTASRPSGRLIGARSAAVLLALGALAVGLSACGSSSSTSATRSTSSVAKKEAGYKDVQLTVVNKSLYRLSVKMCGADCETVDLGAGESKTVSSDRVDGQINVEKLNAAGSCCDVTNDVYFSSDNPDVGEPSITVGKWDDYPNLPQWHLAEGDTRDTTVGGNVFFMARGDDTDVKVMTLTAAR
jgi:hypothetical protein